MHTHQPKPWVMGCSKEMFQSCENAVQPWTLGWILCGSETLRREWAYWTAGYNVTLPIPIYQHVLCLSILQLVISSSHFGKGCQVNLSNWGNYRRNIKARWNGKVSSNSRKSMVKTLLPPHAILQREAPQAAFSGVNLPMSRSLWLIAAPPAQGSTKLQHLKKLKEVIGHELERTNNETSHPIPNATFNVIKTYTDNFPEGTL